jgi:hypothetical protein
MNNPPQAETMRFEVVRKLTITALFSDDLLFEQLVLKGGNAMNLVHRISSRTSVDLDFSIEQDFEDQTDVSRRMEEALARRFTPFGWVPFDVKLSPKPSTPGPNSMSRWGGYKLEFKLVDENLHRSFYAAGREKLRREALVVGPNQMKVFTVDFSKWEYTGGKTRTEFDDYTIYVYSPAMIALEKLRAICQQMEEYRFIGRNRRARARDFYDIYVITENTDFSFDDPRSLELTRLIFGAKEVPLFLLGKITDQREFHRVDWPSVRGSVSEKIEEFDYYFDFVVSKIDPLHALWMK